MATGRPSTEPRAVRALAVLQRSALIAGRHEPYESRGSRADLWGPEGEIPSGYPAASWEKSRRERGRCGSRRRAQAIPLMKRRKQMGDIKTRDSFRSWDEPGGCLLIGQAVSGVEVARAWSGLSCGTCEPVSRWGGRPVERLWPAAGRLEREPQAAESARGSVAMRGAGADRLVVAGKPGNAGGAKGTGRPGSVGGQP